MPAYPPPTQLIRYSGLDHRQYRRLDPVNANKHVIV